ELLRERREIRAFADELLDLLASDELEREHLLRGERAVDLRDVDRRRAFEVLLEALDVLRLDLEVALASDALLELGDHPHEVEQADLGEDALRLARQEVEDVDVALDLARDARPLHLDDD